LYSPPVSLAKFGEGNEEREWKRLGWKGNETGKEGERVKRERGMEFRGDLGRMGRRNGKGWRWKGNGRRGWKRKRGRGNGI